MSYLLYCIFREPLLDELKVSTGVDGQRVFMVGYQGLGAALSQLAGHDLPHANADLLVYRTVVESFSRHQTVIPLRYGCQVESPWEAVGLLRKNHDTYDALLHELEGLGQMGRVWPMIPVHD